MKKLEAFLKENNWTEFKSNINDIVDSLESIIQVELWFQVTGTSGAVSGDIKHKIHISDRGYSVSNYSKNYPFGAESKMIKDLVKNANSLAKRRGTKIIKSLWRDF